MLRNRENVIAKLIHLKKNDNNQFPGFYGWFDINPKTLFIEIIIQSAKEKFI